MFETYVYCPQNQKKNHDCLIGRLIDLTGKADNPCKDNGGCQHLCLLKPLGSDLTRVCACPENHDLASDNRSCIANCKRSASRKLRLSLSISFSFK